jgi:cobalt-zinc-cadmium efflux system outer membrane protein
MPITMLTSRGATQRVLSAACLGVLLVAPHPLQGQSRAAVRLSLDQAIETARSVSPELAAARHAVSAAEARVRQAGARPNPAISYEREQTSGSGATNSQDIVAVEQRLELGAIRSSRIAAARARHDASIARMDAMRAQLDFETTRAYALVVAADHRLRLAEQAATAFARAVRVSDQRLASGDVSGFSHRRLQLESARYATIHAEALLASRAAAIALATLVSGSPDAISLTTFELSDSLPAGVVWRSPDPTRLSAVLALRVDSLIRRAIRARGDLRGLELDAVAARADARFESATRLPTPAFSLGVKSERVPGATGTASGFVAGVSMPLAIWDRREGAVSAATADIARALADAESLRRRVAREVAEAFHAWRSLEEALAALRPHLGDAALRAMRAVQVAYDEGEVTLLEWLDAVRAYQEAETSLIGLRAEAMIRRAALARAVGASFTNAEGAEMSARN